MRCFWVALSAACLLLVSCTAFGAQGGLTWTSKVTVLVEDSQHNLLGSHDYAWGGVIPQDKLTTGPLRITFSLTPEPFWGQALFDDVSLLGNTGKTVWISSNASDSFYSTMVDRLTDGQSGKLYGFFVVSSGAHQVGGGEASYTESSFVDGCRADFSNKSIGRIGLRIEDASAIDKSSIVPEPAAAVALLSGLIGVCRLASRRRR